MPGVIPFRSRITRRRFTAHIPHLPTYLIIWFVNLATLCERLCRCMSHVTKPFAGIFFTACARAVVRKNTHKNQRSRLVASSYSLSLPHGSPLAPPHDSWEIVVEPKTYCMKMVVEPLHIIYNSVGAATAWRRRAGGWRSVCASRVFAERTFAA
ncbi:unnamed protein product [Ectocarpus sp. 8 AP-2014]